MSALGMWLSAAVVWIIAFRVVQQLRPGVLDRRGQRIHVLVAGILAAAAVLQLMGLRAYGTAAIPRAKQRRIEHSGFYSAAGRFSFSAAPVGDQFPAPALAPGETLSLRPLIRPVPAAQTGTPPVTTPSSEIQEWALSYRASRLPLRVNGAVVNANPDWWIDPGGRVSLGRGEQGLSVVIERDNSISIEVPGSNGTPARAPLLSRPLKEGLALGAALRRPSEPVAQLVRHLPPEVLSAADGIVLVRERVDDPTSRIGVLVDREFRGSLTKAGTALTSPETSSRVLSPIAAGAHVSYGLGLDDRFGLVVPSRVVDSREMGPIVPMEFEQAVWWPLPPQAATEFMVSSRAEDSTKDGYWIDIGGDGRVFYAKGTIAPDFDAMKLNTGSRVSDYALRERAYLGDREHGAVIALADARQPVAYAGRWALGIIAGLTIVAMWLLLPAAGVSDRLRLALTLVWEISLFIVVARVVVAFRASLLPPFDERFRGLFTKSLGLSLWALALVPAAVLLPVAVSRFVGRRRSRYAPASSTQGSFSGAWLSLALVAVALIFESVAWIQHEDSVFHLRVNLSIVALTLGAIVLGARWFKRGDRDNREREAVHI